MNFLPRDRRPALVLAVIALMTFAVSVDAQSILANSRKIDWSQAGVPGGIPTRTTLCASLSPGVTAAQINSAIAACPSGQVVKLAAGNYSLAGPLTFNNKRNVTLRGAGANQTLLSFSDSTGSCNGVNGSICMINSDPNYRADPRNTANWTAGYAQGTTQITLSNTANLKIGTLINLDQISDTTDDGTIFQAAIHGTTCVGCDVPGRANRPQNQIVKVTAITGSVVTITPGLYMPNWRADRTPGAWWSNDTAVSGDGVEDLSIDASASTRDNTFTFYNAYGNWVKGVRSIKPHSHHVVFWQSAHNTIRDSYFFNLQQNVEESYGVEGYLSSDELKYPSTP